MFEFLECARLTHVLANLFELLVNSNLVRFLLNFRQTLNVERNLFRFWFFILRVELILLVFLIHRIANYELLELLNHIIVHEVINHFF